MTMTLGQDLRFALRRLRGSPTFTLVAVATLALGIGANIAIFSVVHAVLLRPLPMHDDARLVRVYSQRQQGPGATSVLDFMDLREQGRALEGLSAVTSVAVTLAADSADTSPEKVQAALVTGDFFPMLGARVQMGRALHPDDVRPGAPKVAVISHGLWQRRFGGSAEVLGRSVDVGAPEPLTVVGVMAPGFDFPSGSELWNPLLWDEGMTKPEGRGAHWLEVYGRLRPGVSLASARTELSTIAGRLAEQHPQTNEGKGARVEPLRDVLVGEVRPSLLMMLGAVGLVLLIACANLTHLLLARAASREGEVSVRIALGASRGRIARELLVECGVLAGLGAAVGLLVAMWAVDALVAWGPRDIPRIEEVSLDGSVLAFTAGLAGLTMLLFGLVPALQAGRLDLVRGLRRVVGGGGAPGHRTRSALIVAETALAVLLLVCAGLLLRSFVHLQRAEPGFDPEGVLTVKVELPPRHYGFGTAAPAAFYDALLERLRALPGVVQVGAVTGLPLDGARWTVPVKDPVRPVPEGTEPWRASVRIVTPGALEALRVKVLQGRGITASDQGAGGRAVLVNAEAARRFWPGEDPLGRTLDTGMDWGSGAMGGRVVGVVEDMALEGLGAPALPEVYVPYAQGRSTSMVVLLRTTGAPLDLAPAARAELRALDASLALGSVRTLGSVVERTMAPLRFYVLLAGTFAAVAVVLAAVGLYGVVAYAVLQRTRELGIRRALGAREEQVLGMVLGRYLGLTACGLVIGLGLAVAASRGLMHLLSGVRPTDPVTYGLVAAVLGAVAFLAVLLPARRAARVSPAVALRAD
ncbi:ABC transporter permease [Corallococcus macrosporus]|uniref:Putative permease n=1 Tax=Myxococcus fulvus (strain ATCC BAA-855 / HW-1) TaxID=483219 RepID=F8C7W1_MYXFH|nr:ABC transporter permease [Corallococcus macrosporus]AEI65712.1 putative permease [Corallococcus macrosporus]